jgi:macrolide transport system ATP-binding/permease protein
MSRTWLNMTWLTTTWLRVKALVKRRRLDRDLEEELRFHLEMREEKRRAEGIAQEDAPAAARRRFGNVTLLKEVCREMWTFSSVETLWQDVRFGARMLAKAPALTLIITVTLALGIGANTAIFSHVNALMLRPLPVAAPEQIAFLAIQQKDAPIGSGGFSYPEFVDFRKQADTFSDVFAVVLGRVRLTVNDRSDQCGAHYVSDNFFPALDVKPAAGRFLIPGEAETPGGPTLAVIGYAYWQRVFSGDPGAIGRQIRVDGKSATIIGVAPKGFQGMFSIFEIDVYLPMSAMPLEQSGNAFWTNRDRRLILAFGRLKPGVSLRQAQSSLDVITARLAIQYPATDKWYAVRAVPEKMARPIPYANNAFVAFSGLFLVLAVFVLLLACMNVENMLLARGAARQREMAIRAALGAGRARLMCQMLTESVLLAILGGAAGMILGLWANHLTSSIHLQGFPLHFDSTFDWRVFTFAATSALLTGIVIGLLPALRASSAEVNSVLHEGSRRNSGGIHHPGFRSFLVVAQVAGSFTLLVVAGLFVRSLNKVQAFDLGFDPGHVLNVVMDPHEAGYDEARSVAFYREIESRVRALPGVQSATLASYVPMGGFPISSPVSIEGHPIPPGQQVPSVLSNSVDPSYFETMRITLLRGRVFTESDNEAAPRVAIINQTMAGRFWPHVDAMGKRFGTKGDAGPFMEVVGVAGNGKYKTIGEDAQSFFYVPLAQNFSTKLALQIRTFVPPESLAAPVKDQITRLSPDLAIVDIETMNQSLEGALGFFAFRLAATLAAVLGTIGLILAIIGVYGVVTFAASQRTHEIGIRMALGANPGDILKMIWRQGVTLVIAGVALGTIAAWALTRGIAFLLVGISPTDPVTYAIVAIVLSGVALLACSIPARRAMRVDPMVALRYE